MSWADRIAGALLRTLPRLENERMAQGGRIEVNQSAAYVRDGVPVQPMDLEALVANVNANGLSPAEDERLAILIEECAEVIQIACKIQRHGYGDHPPGNPETNQMALMRELGDLDAVQTRMIDAGELERGKILVASGQKDARQRRRTRYQPDSLTKEKGGLA